jgi:hypothetical protein
MFLNKIKTIFNIYFKKYLPDKRNFIFKLIKKNSICCEVGVWRGDFSQIIIDKSQPQKLYLIDPWKDFGSDYFEKKHNKYSQENQNTRFTLVNKRFKDQIEKDIIIILRETSKDAIEKIQHIKFDFIYLDGNHKYEFIKFDLENYFTLLANEGYIVGDDYRLKDVKKAVNEFVENNNIKNILIKNDHFIIKKSNFS